MHVIGFVKPKADRKVLSRMVDMFFQRNLRRNTHRLGTNGMDRGDEEWGRRDTLYILSPMTGDVRCLFVTSHHTDLLSQ